MKRAEFEKLVISAFESLPEKFKQQVKNVVFIVEDEPSMEIRRKLNLEDNETLFGLYTGVPLISQGDSYGLGPALPHTIHIYKGSIEEEADGDHALLSKIVRDTIWHEVAHYFGFDEDEVLRREESGTNITK